jgi:hypothetical protein
MSGGSGGGGNGGRTGGGGGGSPATYTTDQIVSKLMEQGHQEFLQKADRSTMKNPITEQFSREKDKQLYFEMKEARNSNPNYKAATEKFDKMRSSLRMEPYTSKTKIW